jgi:excisionase family DNA binding protein
MSADDGDLLYGVPAIAEHLKLRPRQVYHLIDLGKIPSFKIGGKVCSRRSSLAAWLASLEAPAVAGTSDGQ